MASYKKKKKADGKEIAGRLITLFFVLLLIGGAYYLYTLFRNVEINSQNLAGTWKLSGNPDTYYTFKMDKENSLLKGEATSYTQANNSIDQKDKTKYTYELVLNENEVYELRLQPVDERGHKDGDIVLIKVTGLSAAQMYVTINKSSMTAMTRVDLF